MPLQPLPVTTYLSLVASAQSAPTAPHASSVSTAGRRSGLFETLLGDPRVLYQEVLEDPSRFEPEAMDLIQRLVAGAVSLDALTSTEREMLDRAVLDWSRPRHSSRGSSTSPSTISSDLPEEVERSYQEALEDPDVELEYREGGPPVPVSLAPEVPTDPVPTFWWRQ
jgi:hypothetical protein